MQSSDDSLAITGFFKQFQAFLLENTNPILITSHKQADPDALGAGILLYFIVKTFSKADISFLLPSQSKQTTNIINSFVLGEIITQDFSSFTDPKKYCIVLVDTNQPLITDLNKIFKSDNSLAVWNDCKTRIIIDHHLYLEKDHALTEMQLLAPNFNSASELVYELLKKSNIAKLDKKFLSIGLLGILFDTKRLILANTRVLTNVAQILSSSEETIEDYLAYLDNEKDYSERIANMKSAQRNKLVTLQEKYLISLSFVSSFESSSARALQYLGSDLAAVVNRGKDEVRISFRSTKKFNDETKIHCGELSKFLAEKYNGTGSGHPTAAGCNIGIENTNNELFESILTYLNQTLTSK